MNFEDIEFPVYRKYRNGKNYFKILSPGEFEEVQLVGSKVIHRRITAALFPEKMFVKDLVFNDASRILESAAQEFESIKGRAEDPG